MRLGLKYIREAGGRVAIHREVLNESRPLAEEIAATTVVEVNDNFLIVSLKT